jgi:lambda family phage portal protein
MNKIIKSIVNTAKYYAASAMVFISPPIQAMFGSGISRSRAYEGASFDRQNRYWFPTRTSPDIENFYDIPVLRDRSRDLYRNNAIGRGAIRVLVTNVIGRGLACQPSIDAEFLGLSDDEAEAWQNNTQRLYEQYELDCDAAGQLHMTQIQKLAYLTWKQAGETFASLPMVVRKESLFALRIKLIDPDLVYNPIGLMDSQSMRNGIEVDDNERPTAYNIYDWDGNCKLYSAYGKKTGRRNILHLFRPERPGQSRGIPMLAPVINCIKQLGNYKESEITAAVVSSLYTVFIKSNRPDALQTPYPQSAEYSEPINESQKAEYDYIMAPGAINRLDDDEEIQFANPTRPNSGYEQFINALLKEVGMALEIPYEILTKQFYSSYSASRGAKIEFWKYVLSEREDFIDMFCQPIYEEWLYEQVLIGRIIAPGFLENPERRAEWSKCQWIGESMGQIDQVKEILASQMLVQSRFSTNSAETANLNGGNFAKNARKVKKEESILGFNTLPPNSVTQNDKALDMSKEVIEAKRAVIMRAARELADEVA